MKKNIKNSLIGILTSVILLNKDNTKSIQTSTMKKKTTFIINSYGVTSYDEKSYIYIKSNNDRTSQVFNLYLKPITQENKNIKHQLNFVSQDRIPYNRLYTNKRIKNTPNYTIFEWQLANNVNWRIYSSLAPRSQSARIGTRIYTLNMNNPINLTISHI